MSARSDSMTPTPTDFDWLAAHLKFQPFRQYKNWVFTPVKTVRSRRRYFKRILQGFCVFVFFLTEIPFLKFCSQLAVFEGQDFSYLFSYLTYVYSFGDSYATTPIFQVPI